MPYFMTVITNNMCQLIDANQNTLKHDKIFKFTSLLHSFCVFLCIFKNVLFVYHLQSQYTRKMPKELFIILTTIVCSIPSLA